MQERLYNGKTKLVGLFGYPVEHSFSPPMHNAAFAALGLNLCYLAFNVPPTALAEAVAGARAMDWLGFNLTIPHKEAILPLLDEISPEAEFLGAVNTVRIVEGRLLGYNTDGEGFLQALRQGFPQLNLAGQKVVIIGAGGAAKGVAFQLIKEGVGRLILANRTPSRAEAVVNALNKIGGAAAAIPLAQVAGELADTTLLINASPVGMYPHADVPPLVPQEALPPHLLVCDLIYNPPQTSLLQAARRAGCPTLNGRGMLLHQGAIAFTLWTGHEAPLAVMAAQLPD